MNKVKNVLIYSSFLFNIITFLLLVVYFTFLKLPSTQKIFNRCKYSVVELKSQTSDDIVTYGSAVFIDDKATLVSNAHMISYKEAGENIEYESFKIRFSFETEYRDVSLIK